MQFSLYLFLVLSFADVVISRYGIAYGSTEMNPFVPPEWMLGVKVCALSFILGALWLIKKIRYAWASWWTRCAAGFMVLVVVNNVYQIYLLS